jgi:hypothetical protein
LKIAALLGVKDEVELIGHTIDHLRSIGVDLIIACDMNSTDGTKDVLESRRSEDLQIMHGNDLNPDTEEFGSLFYAAIASAAAANADWLLFQDADEFWIPATGNLKECTTLEDADLLSVDRFHVPLVRGETTTRPPIAPNSYDRLFLVVKSVPNFREFMRENPTAPWILGVPLPKVIVRPALVASFTQGCHDVVPIDGVLFRRSKPAELLIAHLPFTTQARFARKIANIQRNIHVHEKNYYRGDAAWHWRRWIALADQEGINAEFERSSFDPEAIEILRRQGIVRSAAEVFSERGC